MGRESIVLDAMRVPVTGDPRVALVRVDHDAPARGVECEVLVVGGGMGGVSAALAAARRGKTVCLVEETDWLGGQVTSQGVSALDEHEHIEAFGGTRSYYELREAIRDHYRGLFSKRDLSGPFNPGTSWVSRIAFEPRAALQVLNDLLSPFVETGQVQIFLRAKAVEAIVEDDRVTSLKTMNLDDGSYTLFTFEYLLDATELGDLLPLTGTEYVSGAESIAETGEPHAQPERCPTACKAAHTPSSWSAGPTAKTTASRNRISTTSIGSRSRIRFASTSTAERFMARSRAGWTITCSRTGPVRRGRCGSTGGWSKRRSSLTRTRMTLLCLTGRATTTAMKP